MDIKIKGKEDVSWKRRCLVNMDLLAAVNHYGLIITSIEYTQTESFIVVTGSSDRVFGYILECAGFDLVRAIEIFNEEAEVVQ